jgi:hypothetical protein
VVPEKYKKEVNALIWKFIWDNKPSQIERSVCCFDNNEKGSCCMSHHYDRFNDECTHMFYWWHYLHHVVCQINMSWWMYTHVLLIALLTSYCMSDQYVRCNDQHGVGSVISKRCVYIHHYIWQSIWHIPWCK